MNEVAWIWSLAALVGVILLAFAIRFIARRVEVIEDAIKGLADDVDENAGEHKLQLIGISGPLEVQTDRALDADLDELRQLRLECFRLSVKSEISDRRKWLEMPECDRGK